MASISSASSVDVPSQNANRSAEVKEKSKRPQLSCRNCRLRKVKCDRVQPCTACSLHQIATECTYDLTEQERQPILQAEALRQKDREIEKLRNEVHNLSARTAGQFLPEGAGVPGAKHRSASHVVRALSAGQIQPYENGYEDQEMMMARSMSVTQELADMTLRQKNPSGRFEDFSGYRLRLSTTNSYPFPTLWSADEGVSALYKHLPPRNELLSYLDSFEKRAVGVAFPYYPKPCSRKNVDRFLAQLDHRAELEPDVLALIYAAMAQGVLYGAFDRYGCIPPQGAMGQQIGKSNLFMAVAFQALRVFSFLSRPSLCTIETLLMLSQCLCDTGKFVDAWVLIGTTVRLAVLAKYHRHPVSADMEILQEEQSHKANLWWWLLSLDATSSMVCGRPLGASTTGDCPPADRIGDNSSVGPLTGLRNEVTMICRTVLDQRRFSGSLIQSLTDQLFGVIQSSAAFFPHGFTWQDLSAPSWPLDGQLASIHVLVYTLIILVNQQRHKSRNDLSDPDVAMSYNNVLESARGILRIFKFVKLRISTALQNWTLCQAAFNAAVLLLRGMAAQGLTSPLNQGDQELVTTAHNTFLSLHEFRIHSLAGCAAQRIWGLFKDFTEHGCMPGEVLSKDGMELIEGADVQGTLMTGYEFASGDSDMSSPHEERSPPGPPSFPTNPGSQQQQQQQQQSQQTREKPSKKVRPGQATPSITNARSGNKRTPRKDKDSSKARSSHGWSTSESHAMSQGGRQWSVSKKQHQQSSSRLGPAPQKPRSRGTGAGAAAAASQYMSAQSSQYLPSDVLSSFPNPPSNQMPADASGAWDELASQMLSSTAGQSGQLQQMHGNVPVPVTMASQGGHHPTTANAVPGEVPNINGAPTNSHSQAAQQQQQAATIAAQHAFTSNSHTYSQPQSPALWGFAFNPLTEQGLGAVQDEASQQGVGQEQQPLFPGGVTDPRYFWDLNDESGTQFFWGG